ncbi:hypothetical protein ACFWB1_18110 [Streptomyces goshikiensis]|uniref:hypothetical protein n=1 Tax=Streptomyces goshikiensis TaxID=1942 RepID=UPI003679875E
MSAFSRGGRASAEYVDPCRARWVVFHLGSPHWFYNHLAAATFAADQGIPAEKIHSTRLGQS